MWPRQKSFILKDFSESLSLSLIQIVVKSKKLKLYLRMNFKNSLRFHLSSSFLFSEIKAYHTEKKAQEPWPLAYSTFGQRPVHEQPGLTLSTVDLECRIFDSRFWKCLIRNIFFINIFEFYDLLKYLVVQSTWSIKSIRSSDAWFRKSSNLQGHHYELIIQ